MGNSPRVAIIGAGFAGLGLGYYLKKAGIESFTIYEKAGDVGGVWRENTYPGAACDAASHLYSYSFEPHYPWSCRYGKQAEILAYQKHVARKYDLLRHIQFGREVAGAEFDQARGLWNVRFSDGKLEQVQVLVSAVGQLHRPAFPNIPGMHSFRGRAFHSAQWDHDYDFRGKTVAVIGTGASAVQFVPEIARLAKQLHVYQRSPGWVIPKFERVFSRFERGLLDRLPFLHDLDRWRIFWLYEWIGAAFFSRSWVAWTARVFTKALSWLQLHVQVRNRALRRTLTPDFPIGCKRTLLSNDWLPALARPNVEVVTQAIAAITPTAVVGADGTAREVDAIVYSTGFEASQFLAPMKVRGRNGVMLDQLWQNGAEAFLGVTVAGFPNFFMQYGPNTNIGGGSIIYMLEAQSRYIVQCVQHLRDRSLRFMDLRHEVQRGFNQWIRQRSKDSAYEGGCQSWYVSADGRNINNWVDYMSRFARMTREVKLADYELVPATPG